ncbi:diguanylate cyclase [Denitromonas halophila]|uniref:diguanylate cyclase n=2 Tax=Denitromonas halophila TaxID=1629404 RepID=A0A557QZE8_9RHOO|nr:diguanylate cyclase [Denitromonas halophila]
MADFSTPSEIARESLKRLAMDRVAPTPDNYRAYYHRIAGTKSIDGFPDEAFRGIASELPKTSPAQQRFARRFDEAISSQSWPAVRAALREVSEATGAPDVPWAPLIQQIIDHMDRHHAAFTKARKKESLKHVLDASSTAAPILHSRLSNLIKHWSSSASDDDTAGIKPAEPADQIPDTAPAPAPGPASLPSSTVVHAGIPPEVSGALDELMRRGVGALLADAPELQTCVTHFGARLNPWPDHSAQPALLTDLHELILKLEWSGEDLSGIRRALIALVQLLIDNISKLVIDDKWLTGQLSVVSEAFAQPLDIRILDEVERRLRDVIDQQGRLKQELTDAQFRLKQMLAGFVDRLADMSESAGSFHDNLERSSIRIAEAKDISELSNVVEDMLRETRVAQEDARRSRDDLTSLQQQVEQANVEIGKLQNELHHTSELVRHDPLTGALNRKGLDEALEREISRARRRDVPLCVGLLDVDNFKRINDTHGHHAGDAALQHLAEVIRGNLRPQDSLGRYGGEEFVVILPDTDVEHAVAAVTRLQRALTTRYFLAEGQKLLITFSAGVARLEADEAAATAIDRADKAMYRAKRAGKNRVMVA